MGYNPEMNLCGVGWFRKTVKNLRNLRNLLMKF